ncbi:CypX Cytochrome P450 [Pyrenophora tritici-repentis]|uniref:Benzoate 4-monooxygenase cytochrome p450 n=2 Tax=Pyrenophora tritici-repentis TaxID=45151 RepID=A0A2W1G755_9PLEO|nr:benzoate 4-monooxygenase cytochrome p450 [Pyrenophora tritici-repentis]KAF7444835.1 benzoate 4-monooxygenase cytochrome p450 [Pyrenophora tritici-repentis]KAF7564499.1 CypX, Cytochrome P450 [Pyrenophora tritici-repentis]KAG9379073.1 benzoate 4-monooxygenase cytochrome p450 [Pyrenophora tritici-repentis]KAI0580633.1 benzoate 4-monooxygenase cytochrome p450 [Pyrenophora tritici-repentis]
MVVPYATEMSHLPKWLIAALGIVSFLILRAIYRLALHPLKAFPGPASRAVSHVPHAKSILSGYLPYELTALHAKYGDAVRIAPDMVSFIAPEAWTDIYGHGPNRNFPKWGMTRSHKTVDHILSANNADHSRQRRLVNHAFSDKALRAQEGIVMRYIDQLTSALEVQSTTEVNVKNWLEWTAFDIVGDLAFGEPFGCLSSGAYHPWVELLFPFIKALSLFGAARLFKPFTPLIIALLPKKDIKRRFQHIKLSAEKVHKRLAAGEQPHRSDFWTYILRHNDEKGMSIEEMESNAGIFISGGSETVATALCGIMYLLATNPGAMHTLREEVTSAFSKKEDINMISVAGLKVLQATISEGMRIYPPVPAGLQRIVPKGGAIVAGHAVPGGTIVNVSQQPAYHLASNFAYPKRFAPERWLSNAPSEYSNDMKDAFQPFSTGPRNCVGKNLALAEMKLILARLVWQFDWQLADDKFALEKQRVFIMREKPDLNLRLTPRRM